MCCDENSYLQGRLCVNQLCLPAAAHCMLDLRLAAASAAAAAGARGKLAQSSYGRHMGFCTTSGCTTSV